MQGLTLEYVESISINLYVYLAKIAKKFILAMWVLKGSECRNFFIVFISI